MSSQPVPISATLSRMGSAPAPVSQSAGASRAPFDMYWYRRNIGTYYARTALHAIPAIALGLVIDKVMKKIQDKYDLKPLTVIIVQLIVMILVLYVIEKAISKHYADEWQGNTPGLFFVAFFFGTQFNLFNNIAEFGKQVAREDK